MGLGWIDDEDPTVLLEEGTGVYEVSVGGTGVYNEVSFGCGIPAWIR